MSFRGAGSPLEELRDGCGVSVQLRWGPCMAVKAVGEYRGRVAPAHALNLVPYAKTRQRCSAAAKRRPPSLQNEVHEVLPVVKVVPGDAAQTEVRVWGPRETGAVGVNGIVGSSVHYCGAGTADGSVHREKNIIGGECLLAVAVVPMIASRSAVCLQNKSKNWQRIVIQDMIQELLTSFKGTSAVPAGQGIGEGEGWVLSNSDQKRLYRRLPGTSFL